MSQRPADHWHRVAQHVRAIEDLPRDVQRAAVDTLDESDELIADVLGVLDGDPETLGFLSSPLAASSDNTIGEGARIGEFLLGRRLASGGMGTVYEATQETPHRKVALKLMTSGLTTDRARRRFEIEAEILAHLSHPGIAQIHASGVHRPAGGGFEIPWFALELVEGARDVLTFAREENLSMRERLELFLEVCEAVESGHKRGVLHRDLKPSNVLVGKDRRVKVIDFGVARATSNGHDCDASAVTRTGEVFGTVTAMSPEQFLGDPRAIDVRTDVYSLGVMLYELVCGLPPHDLDGVALLEAARIVRDLAPAVPQKANPDVDKELGWILLCALEKSPRDRYPSVAAFAEDIVRHVRHEPVSAGPPTTWYRVGKFVRRNRVTVAAGLLALAALVGGTVIAVFGLWEAERNLALANDEIARTDRVNTFLSDLFLSVTPLEGGREVRVVELLDRARTELDESLEQDPSIRASLQHSLGGAYFDLGLYDEGRDLIEDALVYETEHSPIGSPRRLDVERKALRIAHRTGTRSGVADELRALVARCEEHLPKGHSVTMDAWQSLGEVLFSERDIDGAIEALRTGLAIREEHHASDTYTIDRRRSFLAFALSRRGDPQEAVALAERAYERLRDEAGDDDTATLYAQGNLAKIWLDSGRYADARDVFLRFGQALEQRLGPDHPHLLTNLVQIAECDLLLGDYTAGYGRAKESLAAHRRVLGDNAPATLTAMQSLANLCTRLNRTDEATSLFKECLSHFERRDAPEALMIRFNLARMRLTRNRDGLLEEFEDIIDACDRIEGESTTLAMAAWTNVGHVHFLSGRTAEAEVAFRTAIALAAEVFDDDHPYLLDYRIFHVRSLVHLGLDDEARPLLDRVIREIGEHAERGDSSRNGVLPEMRALRDRVAARADPTLDDT